MVAVRPTAKVVKLPVVVGETIVVIEGFLVVIVISVVVAALGFAVVAVGIVVLLVADVAVLLWAVTLVANFVVIFVGPADVSVKLAVVVGETLEVV